MFYYIIFIIHYYSLSIVINFIYFIIFEFNQLFELNIFKKGPS